MPGDTWKNVRFRWTPLGGRANQIQDDPLVALFSSPVVARRSELAALNCGGRLYLRDGGERELAPSQKANKKEANVHPSEWAFGRPPGCHALHVWYPVSTDHWRGESASS